MAEDISEISGVRQNSEEGRVPIFNSFLLLCVVIEARIVISFEGR